MTHKNERMDRRRVVSHVLTGKEKSHWRLRAEGTEREKLVYGAEFVISLCRRGGDSFTAYYFLEGF